MVVGARLMPFPFWGGNTSYVSYMILPNCYHTLVLPTLTNTADAPSNTLCGDLQRLLNDPIFSDVCFLVEGKTVHAHKAILATRCEYFQAMFNSKMEECNKVMC